MVPLLILTVWLMSFNAVAQLASSSWRKPNITVSQADCINLAQSAIEENPGSPLTVVQSVLCSWTIPGDSYGAAGNFFSQLAQFDLATNQTKYSLAVQQYFSLAGGFLPGISAQNFTGELFLFHGQISDGLNYGYAAITAYNVYKNPVFVGYAEQAWWAANTYTLLQKDVDVGIMPVKNFTLKPTCQDFTMAGGTFREKASTSPNINALSTGEFFLVSALLAEATGDDIYLEAAKASVEFMHAHLYSPQHVVYDTILPRANDSCEPVQDSVGGPFNSGLMIEGLAVLYSITQNASLTAILDELLTATIPFPEWQGSNGVLTKSDMMLPRALATVNARKATTPTLQAYINAYLSVQFNAVIDLARINGSNIYGGSWNGPPSSIFAPGDQSNAIQVLINAIDIADPVSPTTASSSSTSSSPTSSSLPDAVASPRKASKVGPIVGGILGGLVLLIALLVVGILWQRRRRRRATTEDSYLGVQVASSATPPLSPPTTLFDLPAPSANRSSKFPIITPDPYPSSAQGSSSQYDGTTLSFRSAPGSTSQYDGSVSPSSTELPTRELHSPLTSVLACNSDTEVSSIAGFIHCVDSVHSITEINDKLTSSIYDDLEGVTWEYLLVGRDVVNVVVEELEDRRFINQFISVSGQKEPLECVCKCKEMFKGRNHLVYVKAPFVTSKRLRNLESPLWKQFWWVVYKHVYKRPVYKPNSKNGL
ncbi:hypothetical protein B0H13DRAFT_2261217 [Mycena leptocephala]|nr:hypothetical protein B0H13DRAFT_2261217 [Mycena leptocephala]